MADEQVPREFQARPERDGETMFLWLAGEFDIACKPDFHAALDELVAGRPSCVVVDLSELTFIDSSGLDALLAAWQRARGDGFELAIVPSPSEHVRRTLRISGLDEVLPLTEEVPSLNGTGPMNDPRGTDGSQRQER
jgi:anti-sigma B factor antagonist